MKGTNREDQRELRAVQIVGFLVVAFAVASLVLGLILVTSSNREDWKEFGYDASGGFTEKPFPIGIMTIASVLFSSGLVGVYGTASNKREPLLMFSTLVSCCAAASLIFLITLAVAQATLEATIERKWKAMYEDLEDEEKEVIRIVQRHYQCCGWDGRWSLDCPADGRSTATACKNLLLEDARAKYSGMMNLMLGAWVILLVITAVGWVYVWIEKNTKYKYRGMRPEDWGKVTLQVEQNGEYTLACILRHVLTLDEATDHWHYDTFSLRQTGEWTYLKGTGGGQGGSSAEGNSLEGSNSGKDDSIRSEEEEEEEDKSDRTALFRPDSPTVLTITTARGVVEPEISNAPLWRFDLNARVFSLSTERFPFLRTCCTDPAVVDGWCAFQAEMCTRWPCVPAVTDDSILPPL